ncbi:unnamed protein product [Brachionus calyciflorus]|uniref:Reverse transcriptase domain-containing protein n=1 Tax=Brachionus calyciflorus TaxID=104777 RepID=A0A813RGW8_9BILA|nr:unnamed protein product [Brachionus calyciflorus]
MHISDKLQQSNFKDKETLTKVIENTLNKMNDAMLKAVDEIKEEKLIKKYKLKINGWWDKDIEDIYKDFVRAKKKYKNENTTVNKILYKKAKKAFREKQLENKEKEEVKQLVKRNILFRHDRKRFYKQVEEKLSDKTSTNIDIITAKNEVMKLFNEKLVNDNRTNESDDKINKEFDERYRDVISDYKVDVETLKSIISKLENKKATGISKVSNEMLKFGCCEKLLRLICLIFETMINYNIMPGNFNIGLVKLLIKDHQKDHNDINNLRPITVSDTFSLIFEKLLLKEINKNYKQKSKQFGFKDGSSCMHALLTLKELILYNKRKNKKTYVGTIDASKAFDKVTRNRLWVVVCVGEILSSIFKTTVGVKQGGPLSPLLFAIYVDELIELLEELKIGVDVLNFIINLESYGVQNDIKFNHDKTQFIIFGDVMSKTEKQVEIKFQGELVKRVSSIKYLGVYLDEKLDERLNLNKRKNAYLCGFNKFKRLGIQDLNVSTEIKLYYYKTYIRPLLFYGFEVIRLNINQTKSLQVLESNLIKSMFGVKKHKRSSKLLKACNIDSVKVRAKKMRTKMGVRIFRNELTEKLITKLYESDFSARTNSRSIIGNLKVFTVGGDETLGELVQEALLTIEEENGMDRDEIMRIKEVLKTEGKMRRDELNRILDVNFSHL